MPTNEFLDELPVGRNPEDIVGEVTDEDEPTNQEPEEDVTEVIEEKLAALEKQVEEAETQAAEEQAAATETETSQVASPTENVEHGDLVTQTDRPEPRKLRPGESVPPEVVRSWDAMLSGVSQPTRMAIWESGLDSMQKLLSTPRRDLIRPRGHLTKEMVNEIDNWCRTHLNMTLPDKQARSFVPPPPDSIVANVGHRKMTPQLAAMRKARMPKRGGR